LSFAIELAILTSITTAVLINLLAIPRVAYQLARDGLLPQSVSRIHPKYRTPYVSTVACGIVTALLASRLSLQTVAALASVAALVQFAGVCIGVLVVRRRRAERPRGFTVPHLALVGNAGWLLCLLLAAALALHDISIAAVFGAWTGVGLAIYALYGYRHSRLRTRPER
jgi:APA family basic amino acid/polyamine antiporter